MTTTMLKQAPPNVKADPNAPWGRCYRKQSCRGEPITAGWDGEGVYCICLNCGHLSRPAEDVRVRKGFLLAY